MDKHQVAAILDEIGILLELQGENPFRCRAYHNAARAVESIPEDLATLVRDGGLMAVPGIGETLRDKIATLVQTGALKFHDDLKRKTPPGLLQMLRIPGLGPKKVKVLYEELRVKSLEELKTACEAGQVAALKGFGNKTATKILEGINFLSESGERVRLDQALPLAQRILDGMRDAPGLVRLEVCGSLRRRRETIADIDVLASAADAAPLMQRFVTLPGVVQVVGQGDTKATITMSAVTDGGRRVMLNADLRVVRDEQFPFALHYFTGNKDHNVAMRVRAQAKGLKLNEYELASDHKRMACHDEADIYRALGMDYIPPELREHTGEMEAAANGTLPHLVEVDDIKGVFHCHTTYSDGGNSLEEMAEAARKLGLKYLGFGDHSQSLTVANGMSIQRVRKQQAEIDALNKRLTGIRLFKGVECDILADGRLDYPDEVLASFDYVVASVHSHFAMPREEMTQRIIRAIRHPAVTILGHATGRLLLRREGYQVDIEALLQAAAQEGTLVEINAHPQRLDLDWVHCKRAKTLGVQMVINPDAHSTEDIALYRFGVDVARRGWLEKGNIFNTRSAAEVARALAARKKKRGLP